MTGSSEGPRQPLQYSNLPDVMPSEGKLFLGCAGMMLLTFVSLMVVMKSANDEPYMTGVLSTDVMLHIIAAACILGWLALIIAAADQLRRRNSYAVVIAMLVWATINIFYLSVMVLNYAQQVTR